MSAPFPSTVASTSPISAPRVSILVVNYNGEAFLEACLDSLRHIDYPNFEVVVVDNASTDRSWQVLERFHEVRRVRSDRNRGFAGGNNFGLRHCTGDLILLLNSDTVVTPGFLSPLAGWLIDHPESMVVQGKMIVPGLGGVLDACGSHLTPLGFPCHRGYLKPDGPRYSGAWPVFCGKGACLLLRREAIELSGGFLFDEDYFCYYEESDFCHRVWMGGGEVYFVGAEPIQHLMGGTSVQMKSSAFALSHYLRNQTFTLCANLEAATLLRVVPPYFLMLCLSLVAQVLRRDVGAVRAHLGALVVPYTERHRIRARRLSVAAFRKRSDAELWPIICRWPGWDYFWKTFQGRLADHSDPDFPRSGS